MSQLTPAQHMDRAVRSYIQACNDADAEAIAACFCPNAVHYFPSSYHRTGAVAIGSYFAERVREHGFYWSVDSLLIDVDRGSAVLEWSRFNRQQTQTVRGVDWFDFNSQTWGIQELRAYTAAPIQTDVARQEFLDFDYAGRGYPTVRPPS